MKQYFCQNFYYRDLARLWFNLTWTSFIKLFCHIPHQMAKKLFSRNSWSNFFFWNFWMTLSIPFDVSWRNSKLWDFCYIDCLTDDFWRCYVLVAKPTCNALDSQITFPRWQLEAQIFTTKYFDYIMTLSVLPGILLSPFKTPTECAETKIF